MPEPTTQTTEVTPPAEHNVRNVNAQHSDRNPETSPSFKLPEKFKSVDDLVKAYENAETKITEYGTKYKNYDDYAKIGPPDQIKEALEWAKNVKMAMDRGLLKPAAEAEAARKQEQSTPTAPWESQDWEYKSEADKYRLANEYQQADLRKYIDGIATKYGEQISGLRQTDGREKSILLKTMQALAKNPSLDPNDMLSRAAEMAQRSPEELLDMVMESQLNTPEARQKDIDKAVETRLAEEKQNWEKDRFTDITTFRKPKFSSKNPDRRAEDRQILENLAKQGIRFN